MTTSDTTLPWHAAAWREVCASMNRGRLAHALLLIGHAGLGKRAFAERLARLLLCERPVATAEGVEPCGHCGACAAMRQRAHPGFRLLQRAADGTRDIPVDAVRDACAYLALTGAAARAKVLVVDRADDLNANGFNALLKSVEEPSGDAYIVLTSETSDLLPATLRSRCQTLRFHAPSGSEALAYLAQAMPESNERVRLQALEETLDAPLLAQRLLSDLPHLERYAQWSEQLQNLLAGGRAAVEVPSPGVDRELVADYARHASVWAWRASRHALATQRSAAATIRIAHEADRLARHLHANAQPRLALDSFMIACGALKAR